jgi:predicted nucleotidyltransferase
LYSKTDLNNIIHNFINLVSAEIPLKTVYLFGSYATGKAGRYSDIDLAIVSDKFIGDRFDDRNKLNKYILKTSIDIEVHPFTIEEFTEDDPFVKEIIETGIKIA